MTLYFTPSEAIVDVTHRLLDAELISPRGQATREMLNHQFTITRPDHIRFLHLHGRKLVYKIGVLEALQLVGQITLPEAVVDRVKTFNNYTDRNMFHGGYGNRIAGRLDDLANLLQRDPDTRQAVLTIYDSAVDLNRDKRDIPCTIALQYFIRDNQVHARTVMRSNDAYLGLPYDLMQFITLQSAIAAHMNMDLGTYTHSVGSMHIYERDIANVTDDTGRLAIRDDLYNANIEVPPAFEHADIGVISQRCRRILNRQPIDNPTEFETWMTEQIA